MKKTIFIIFITLSSAGYSQNDFETIYHIIQTKAQINLSLLNNKIQVVNIYKQQIKSIYENRNRSKDEGIIQFIKDVYFPYKEFWNNFFNEDGFKKWIDKNWTKFQNIESPGLLIPFEIDFDSLFTSTVIKLNKLTSMEPKGKWYLVYGNRASNIGGFYNGDMFVDFFGIGNKGTEHLIINLPHEINHQIFSKTNIDDGTLLYTILDEGLACYVNYLYWEKKYSPAQNIDFTDEEWEWCIKNENKIFDYAKVFLDSTNEETIHKFQRAHQFIFDGAPDRIAYFIGFRICQAYVENNGMESWKDIYNMNPKDVLKLSNYENFTNK